IAMAFDPASFSKIPEGFGFLVPRRERRRIAACTFMGTKFPFRTPREKILLRCFLLGDGEGAATLPGVLDELGEMIGLTGEPLFSRIYRWPSSMAQYTIGHRERVAAIEAGLRANRGIYIAGNAFHGIGIPDCIR